MLIATLSKKDTFVDTVESEHEDGFIIIFPSPDAGVVAVVWRMVNVTPMFCKRWRHILAPTGGNEGMKLVVGWKAKRSCKHKLFFFK